MKEELNASGSKAITRKPLSRSQNKRQMQEEMKEPEPEPVVEQPKVETV